MGQRQTIKLGPQPGPQTMFLQSQADIVIFGGSAGGGKTYVLVYEPLRHVNNPLYTRVTFRLESPQIRNPGGLWDESLKLYGPLGLSPKQSTLEWKAVTGWKHKFAHLMLEADMFSWQGAQLVSIGWDELTHFSLRKFWYLQSRLRSMSGIRGYTHATCNPDPDSWVADFIEWWINQETGYPIPERAGKLRFFIRVNDELVWADTRDELVSRYPRDGKFAKSLTFIPSSVYDNKILMQNDPQYEATLRSLSLVERERLLKGNWKIRAAAGTVFKRHWFEIVDAAPAAATRIRYWDRAGTEPNESNKDPDWTAGLKLSRDANGIVYIEDVVRVRQTPFKVEETIKNTATQDGIETNIGIEQDPGQAGKAEANYYVRQLAGFKVKCYPVTKDKITRANPVSAQAEAGNIKIVRGRWNKDLLDELENFPAPEGKGHDDQVDALSGAFQALISIKQITPRAWTI